MTGETQHTRRTQAHRTAETRAQLIQAAAKLLREIGFASVTTQRIAQEAGVTTGALHHHFPTKYELILAVYDHLAERILDDFTEQDHLAADGRLNVPALVRYFWGVYGDPEYWAIWEILIGTRSDTDAHPEFLAARLQAISELRACWLSTHVDTRNVQTEMLDLLELVVIAVRGLGLERLFHKDEAYFERHLQTMTDVIQSRYDALMARP